MKLHRAAARAGAASLPGQIIACAFLSPQKEGTYTGYYLGKANVVIDTLAAQEAFQSAA